MLVPMDSSTAGAGSVAPDSAPESVPEAAHLADHSLESMATPTIPDSIVWRGAVWDLVHEDTELAAYERHAAGAIHLLTSAESAGVPLLGEAGVYTIYPADAARGAIWEETVPVFVWDHPSTDALLTVAAVLLRRAADAMQDTLDEAAIRALSTDVWLLTDEGRAEAAADAERGDD